MAIATTKKVIPNNPVKTREIKACGQVIHTGNQMLNTARRISKEIKIHRRGRVSGFSR